MTLEGMKRKVAREISIEGKLKALVEFGASDLLTLPTILTIEQLAYVTQINITTMRKFASAPDFYPKFYVGRCLRISRDAFIQWLTEHCAKGNVQQESDEDDEW